MKGRIRNFCVVLCMLLGVLGMFLSDGVGCCWIPMAIAAGASVLSSLWGGHSASKAARKAKREMERADREDQAWYSRRYNQDYADTAAGSRLITQARDYARRNWQRAAGAGRVAGGTQAAVAEAKDAGNKMVGDTLSQIAANDVARKDAVDNARRARRLAQAQTMAGIEQTRAGQITQAAGNASNALISAAARLGGGTDTGDTALSNLSKDSRYDGDAIDATGAGKEKNYYA